MTPFGPRSAHRSIRLRMCSQLRSRSAASGVVTCRPLGLTISQCRPTNSRPSVAMMSRYSRRCAAVMAAGVFGQRERRDFDARIAGLADGLAGVGKGPLVEGLVADGLAKNVGHETNSVAQRLIWMGDRRHSYNVYVRDNQAAAVQPGRLRRPFAAVGLMSRWWAISVTLARRGSQTPRRADESLRGSSGEMPSGRRWRVLRDDRREATLPRRLAGDGVEWRRTRPGSMLDDTNSNPAPNSASACGGCSERRFNGGPALDTSGCGRSLEYGGRAKSLDAIPAAAERAIWRDASGGH